MMRLRAFRREPGRSPRRNFVVTIGVLAFGAIALAACQPDDDLLGQAAGRAPTTTAKVAATPSTTTTTGPEATTTTVAGEATGDPSNPSLEAARRRSGGSGATTTAAPTTTQAPPPTTQAPPPTTAAPAPPTTAAPGPGTTYPWHTGISTTVFWVGEAPGPDNGYISNGPSAWDEEWTAHYGGYDDPDNRNGYLPAGFTPKENPFYFALPYNDYSNRTLAASIIPWAKSRSWGPRESMVKNQWIEIRYKGKTVYAQWEDVGPYNEDDSAYVFGTAKSRYKIGLDVSPATRDYIGLGDGGSVDWRFVDESAVPAGPWRNVITRSQVSWS